MAVFCETTMSDIGRRSQRARRFALMGGAAQLALLCSLGLTASASPSGPRLVSIRFGTRAASECKARVTFRCRSILRRFGSTFQPMVVCHRHGVRCGCRVRRCAVWLSLASDAMVLFKPMPFAHPTHKRERV